MTTMNDITNAKKPLGRKSLAGLVALELALGPAAPVWAQRRGAEPEANPSFQQSLQQSGSMSGGPIDAEPMSAPASPAASASGDDIPPAAAAQGIQIGTSQPRPAAVERVAPLDARVTVRVKGAPLATFLDTISAQAKVNFIITEGLESRRVTAFLQNVTVREALQVLLEIKGLTYQQIGKSNTYVVMPRSKSVENVITRIYTLSYIPLIPIDSAKDELKSITPQSSLQSDGAVAGVGAAGGVPPAPNQGAGGGGGAAAADSPISIINVLRSIMSRLGKVSVEPRTNSLIVTDIPEVFPQVEQIIAELDKKAPQVIIEAQIVEIDSNRAKDLGLEWGGANGELAKFTGGKRDTTFPLLLPHDLSRTRFLDPIDPSNIVSGSGSGSGGSSSASSGGTTGGTTGTTGAATTLASTAVNTLKLTSGVLDLTSLSVTLRALVSRSEARFLGKPKILTLNNKTALIQISQEQAVSISQTQTSAGGALASQGTKPERYNTGLVLRVTPQVNRDGYITMLVQPSFTDVQASAVSTLANPVFDPISRGASSMVRVKNGQTLVLGGLLESTETKVVRKVPFLGYIPLIGWLFTSTSSSRRNSDLVIFLTPTIVND